ICSTVRHLYIPSIIPNIYGALVRFEMADKLSAVFLLTTYIKRPHPLNIHIGNTVMKTVSAADVVLVVGAG
ncbi:hypothetical protein L9F63_002461, partial [Diploptera punctata]